MENILQHVTAQHSCSAANATALTHSEVDELVNSYCQAHSYGSLTSVLCRCWLRVRKSIWPVKN